MKNIFSKLFLIIFIYLFFVQNTFAFEFIKSSDNPLPVSYIDNYNSQLQVNVFKEVDIYKGIFTIKRAAENYYSLGYFESGDGISWQMKKEILNTGAELSSPRILKTQTGYVLFITRYDNNTVYRIYSSNCDLNFNCSSSFSPVIMPDTSNNSENNGVFAGFPYNQDNRTYLFFGAWGGDGFKIKLAYSDNLINWQRCPDNRSLIVGSDGASPYIENSNLYLFFHQADGSGIKLGKTTLPLSCNSIFEDQGYQLTRSQSYDQRHMIFPSILNDNGGLKLFYSGLGSDSRWRLNLACTGQACIPDKIPIVIIPGLMASWNQEAILHNKTVSYNDWKLLSFVKDYGGLIETLKTINYQENTNLFLFTYDWRQSIEKTTNDLNSYLQAKIWNSKPNQKINLVGHSLGGLVARIFAQKNTNKVNKIISVGSPHLGAVQVYKPLEAGEIDRANTFLWLAEKIILMLNKSTLESDRITITNKFPVAKDLFPTFNFLKNSQGNEISIDSLTIKNSFLTSYNQTLSEIFPLFTAIFGEKDKNTLAGFIVEPQNSLDQLLGNYSDGKPKESYSDLGDYLILSKSASQDTDSEKLYFDHEEIITKKEAIGKILKTLNINFTNDQISEGQKTIISPSLIFMIKSPATMEVVFNGQTYPEQEGIIFIENVQSGDYQLKVKGIEKGQYTVMVGQIGKKKDLWNEIKGEITGNPPASQTDNYNIKFDNNFPKPINNSSSLLDEIISDLNSFNSYNIAAVGYMRNDLKQAKKYLENNDLKKLKSVLLLAHSRLMIISNKINDENGKNIVSSVFEKLENLFISSLQDYSLDQKTISAIITQFTGYQKLINEQSSRLLNLQNKGKDISKQISLIKNINSKLLNINDYLNFKKYSSMEILLKTVSYLINEIKK